MSVLGEPSELTPLRRNNLRQPQSHSTSHSEQPQQQQLSLPPPTQASVARLQSSTANCSAYIAINNNNNNTINQSGSDSSDLDSLHDKTMSETSQVLTRITIDFIVLLAVGLPILAFFLWGEPYKRGFFCDDESLMHPFHDSTIKSWMLYITGIVLPVGLISATEIIQAKLNKIPAKIKLQLFGYTVPTWINNAYRQIGVFAFGAAVSQLATDVAKYSIGRLRPHFFSVCQPIMADGTNCTHPLNIGRYIEEFSCTGDSNNRLLKEMRLSFPSGHSSFSAYTMIYCAIYLQTRMTWRGSRLLKHFLQYLLILMTWFTCLSRISDYKHHWSDVLAGACLGVTVALLIANFVSDLGCRPHRTSAGQTRYELGSHATNNGFMNQRWMVDQTSHLNLC